MHCAHSSVLPTPDPKVVTCGVCGTVFARPAPSDADIEALARGLFVSLQD